MLVRRGLRGEDRSSQTMDFMVNRLGEEYTPDRFEVITLLRNADSKPQEPAPTPDMGGDT